jgi:pyridoxine 5-phosphate synthase
MSIRLHINVDHVATLRNARGVAYPDPVTAASLCELAGADGITCHLREDRRHIRDDDVRRLRASVTTMLNLETAATDEMLRIALELRLDVLGRLEPLRSTTVALREAGIRVSFFLAPDDAQIDAACALGIDQIELHTGEYCHHSGARRAAELARLQGAARRIVAAGVALAAGHGLTRANVAPVAALPGLEELNIGHAVVADAVFLGLDRAVRDLRDAIDRGAPGGPS